MLLRTLTTCLLNTDRHGEPISSLGSIYQCLTTFEKKCFPVPSLTIPWCSSLLFPSSHRFTGAPPFAFPPHRTAKSSEVTSWPSPDWTTQEPSGKQSISFSESYSSRMEGGVSAFHLWSQDV